MDIVNDFTITILSMAAIVHIVHPYDTRPREMGVCKRMRFTQEVCQRPLIHQVCAESYVDKCTFKFPILNDPQNLPKLVYRKCKSDSCKADLLRRCCEEQDVPPGCLHICKYSFHDGREIACTPECADYYKRWMYCAANTMNNEHCCQDDGITQSQCMGFCRGEVPPLKEIKTAINAAHYFPCMQKGNRILECHMSNNPGVPLWKTDLDWGHKEEFEPEIKKAVVKLCSETGI